MQACDNTAPRFGQRRKLIETTPMQALYWWKHGMNDTMTANATMPTEAGTIAGKWLSDAGLRPTRQRMTLATLLIGDGKHRHVTAESLYADAQNSDEAVSLATVYNTLRAFCDAGLLQEVTVDGSKSYFDTNTVDHPHFYWEDENRLSDAPAAELEIARLPKAPDGAEITSVDVVIRLRRTK
jgi:Fur family iron response transcriptional regulator|tara:strand:- start:576 stop:1121 length:546 start_codon:yes stop_codon:yes gene_type:complete